MGSKLGFILSMLFLVQLFALVGDLMSVQFIYTNLDSISVTAGYLISMKGEITDDVKNLVFNQTGASIVQIGETSHMVGEIIEYKIAKNYKAIIMYKEEIEIAVVRSIVIGYYS